MNDTLYEEISSYNETIFQEKQSGLKDIFSYTENPFDLSSFQLDDDMIGYIDIPKLNLHTPLYIGANEENMRKGVTVLSQTSMPIGGNNTNCVIAGHRGGYNGAQLFKNIEQLEINDEILVTNPWETIPYVVVKTIVIEPNNIEAIKIIPDQDMITLFTCHPYGLPQQRYVVYAQRKDVQKEIKLPDSEPYESSIEKIEMEKNIRLLALFISVSLTMILIILRVKEIRKK